MLTAMSLPRHRARTALVGALALALVAALGGCSASSATGTTTSGPSTTTAPTAARTGAAVPARPSAGCHDGATARAGTGKPLPTTIRSSGIERQYYLEVPTSYAPHTPMPLVVDLHGYLEGATVHLQMSGLAAYGAKVGFIDLTPQGLGKDAYWNATDAPDGPKDLQFIQDLLTTTEHDWCVDLNRVDVAGLSMGAWMTSLVGCHLAGEVAAIAPVAGLRWPAGCAPSRPVPVIAFHGTADPILAYGGGFGHGAASLPTDADMAVVMKGFTWAPVRQSLHDWATDEHCRSVSSTKVAAKVTLLRYRGCKGGSVVELYSVIGGGHAWPGSQFSARIASVVGATTFEIDANELMWRFFRAHPL